MPVPSIITDLSATPSANSPTVGESLGIDYLYLQTIHAFLRQNYDSALANLAALASQTAPTGSTLIGYKRTATGAVGSTLSKFMAAQVLNLKSDFGAVGDGTTDDTAAVQAWVNAISANAGTNLPSGYAPTGNYKLTATITIPNSYIRMFGDGMLQTIFKCDDVTGSVFKASSSITFFRPQIYDLGIIDATKATTGIGFDVTAINYAAQGQMLGFEFHNVWIDVKGNALVCYAAFSGLFSGGQVNSSTGHGYVVACGPAVVWTNTYASAIGTGKAGYRLAGNITMYSCNGIDAGGYWGIFGQNPAAADGFQGDFPVGTSSNTSYPDVHLNNCNIETFAVCGIKLHNLYRSFRMEGGAFERTALSSAYESLITHIGSTSSSTGPALSIGVGTCNIGSGVPNGGAGLTNAWIYCPSGATAVVDTVGTLAAAGITGQYVTSFGGLVPIISSLSEFDIYQNAALTISALSTRRLTAGVIRFKTITRTPVGAGQDIDVTGVTKVIVTPVAVASINTASFVQTLGVTSDWQRNGRLIIEAGNGNLTINHNAAGTNTFRMTGGANVNLIAGRVLEFLWSETSSQWIQV